MKLPTWDELTPLEREKYINQDCVSRYKFIPQISPQDYENIDFKSMWGAIELDDSDKLKEVIVGLYLDGKTVDEIGYHVPYSTRHIQRIVENLREGTFLKDKIIELSEKGFSKKRIKLELGCTIQYIRKVLKKGNYTTLK